MPAKTIVMNTLAACRGGMARPQLNERETKTRMNCARRKVERRQKTDDPAQFHMPDKTIVKSTRAAGPGGWARPPQSGPKTKSRRNCDRVTCQRRQKSSRLVARRGAAKLIGNLKLNNNPNPMAMS